MRDLSNLELVQANPENLFRLNRFYRRNGHKGKATADDAAWWLEQHGEILAALRLEQHPWGQLLRGMWVARDKRNQGLGRHLLQQLQPQLNARPCYCFPYQHLTDFYQHCGFNNAQQAPDILRQQLARYQARGETLALMRYQPPCDCLM